MFEIVKMPQFCCNIYCIFILQRDCIGGCVGESGFEKVKIVRDGWTEIHACHYRSSDSRICLFKLQYAQQFIIRKVSPQTSRGVVPRVIAIGMYAYA